MNVSTRGFSGLSRDKFNLKKKQSQDVIKSTCTSVKQTVTRNVRITQLWKKSENMRDIMVKYLKPHTYNYKGTKSVTFMQKPMYVTFLCYGTIILLVNVASGSVVFIFF